MAPMGPKKGPTPSTRGARNPQASTTKASTRGGISKRRGAGPLRVDRDGDLNMDPSATANAAQSHSKRSKKNSTPSATTARGSSSRNPRPTATAQQLIQRFINNETHRVSSNTRSGRRVDIPPPVTLRVEGLKRSKAASNEDGGLRDLLIFLERKAQSIDHISRPIRIKKSHISGDFVYITATSEDAQEILKVNNFIFAGAALHITEEKGGVPDCDPTPLSSTALEIKEQLRVVLSSRYDVNAKLLNLSSLGEDPSLNQMGFFSGGSTPEKMFRALMAVCDGLFKTAQAKRDAIVSISLAGNNVNDVLQIMSLAETFPDIVNLDLSRNQFKDLKALQKWRHRLCSLQTLLLHENPIEGANPNYKAEVVNWFPKLLNLNGTQVRTPEQVAAAEAASRPTPIPQSGADFRDIGGVGEGFITEFLSLYDADRHNLASKYYDEQSTFSIAVNNQSPTASDMPLPAWGAYLKFSRNHTKISHPPSRQQRLFTGVNQIQALWKQLPPTQHPKLITHLNKYLVDCHPIHGLADPAGQNLLGVDGMIMTIHGEFEDQEPGTMKTTKRSFSRLFILGPGAPGRNPIRVVSDMLSVKAFKDLPTPAPTTQTTMVDNQPRDQMLLELCKQTGMTPEYSRFCLDSANWNFDQALASFHEKKAELPREAFAPAA
ncbi:putative mRNA export factor mex67 [Rosellinia necatrix]|uniref:mRNA export factor MEX67 n=1 Tax=Rosellinia necatrix TaxID=77044 RepID=A0A1W2TD73_ROSNE|nr:putative mRNA export factor mex67 [Rosellinia necatrix]